jgi:protein SCO1/2
MTETNPRTRRRTVLRAAGAAALGVPLSGCTDAFGSDDTENVVLEPPENHERREDLDLPFPTYGEELPAATVPAPLQGRELSTREFVGDRHAMLTFIYTTCTTVCPGLTRALRHVQADAVEEGYADEFALMPTTFDPEYDTPERLRTYGREMGVDLEAGNWYFLRPETPERARKLVQETFGVAFEKGQPGDSDGDGASEQGADSDGSHGGHSRLFTHSSLVLLANEDGYVERAYNGQAPPPGTAIDDARALVEGW